MNKPSVIKIAFASFAAVAFVFIVIFTVNQVYYKPAPVEQSTCEQHSSRWLERAGVDGSQSTCSLVKGKKTAIETDEDTGLDIAVSLETPEPDVCHCTAYVGVKLYQVTCYLSDHDESILKYCEVN